eukprot:49114-Prorocentrum_minimum.AAC.1
MCGLPTLVSAAMNSKPSITCGGGREGVGRGGIGQVCRRPRASRCLGDTLEPPGHSSRSGREPF